MMARKSDLRAQRTGTIINATSKQQEKSVTKALEIVAERLSSKYGVRLDHESEWKLASVVKELRERFPEIEFHYYFEKSAMRPDGGILSVVSRSSSCQFQTIQSQVPDRAHEYL